MRKPFIHLTFVVGIATVLTSGCGESTPPSKLETSSQNAAPVAAVPKETPATPVTPAANSTPTAPATATPAAQAVPATPATPATPAAAPATTTAAKPSSVPAARIQPSGLAQTPATPAAQAVQAAPTDAVSLLTKFAGAQTDNVLASLGTDLSGKVKSLTDSLGGNTAVKAQVEKAVTSLVGGKDSEVLASLNQVVAASNLTPQQLQLAKETGNILSAMVVQKNFSSLEGAQGDVATIVNSLRKGEVISAVPAIQKVASNASLTSSQKELIGSIADKYAPGVKSAAGALQQGLKKIPGF